MAKQDLELFFAAATQRSCQTGDSPEKNFRDQDAERSNLDLETGYVVSSFARARHSLNFQLELLGTREG